MADSIRFKGLDQQSIIDGVTEGTELPSQPLSDYTKEQLVQLCVLFISLIRNILTGLYSHSKQGVFDFQEMFDTLHYQARKDSKTSSMRPSSDMFRSAERLKEEQESSASDADTESEDDGAGSDSGNSFNSSPTEEESEKALRKDHKRSLRKPSGKSPGKQLFAQGFGFKAPTECEEKEPVILQPDACKGCERWEECKKNAKTTSCHNVYDLEIRITVTPYKAVKNINCPLHENESQKSEFTPGTSGTKQYGINIKTIVCMLYAYGMVSFKRIQEIVGLSLGLQLSPATMLNFIKELAGKVKDAVDAILEVEKNEDVVNCDESGAKVGNEQHWIHTIATSLYTFVSIQRKRGKEGMDKIGFLREYIGTVVHDCWSTYFSYENCKHATCGIHFIRELTGLSKFFMNASQWADDMIELLQDMVHAKNEAVKNDLKSLPAQVIEGFSNRFDALISRGKEIHPLPEKVPGKRGRPKRGRAGCLIDRMELRKEEIFRFIVDFKVPFTNNIAESSFRLLGTKRNVGIFRDLESAENFCTIWSYISTARKHGVSIYDAIHEAFLGNAMHVIFPNGAPNKQTQQNDTNSDSSYSKEESAA